MVQPQLTPDDVQGVLVSKANIELQNIALRRQVQELTARNAILEQQAVAMNGNKDEALPKKKADK